MKGPRSIGEEAERLQRLIASTEESLRFCLDPRRVAELQRILAHLRNKYRPPTGLLAANKRSEELRER